jgi:2'-5' RNA ligase
VPAAQAGKTVTAVPCAAFDTPTDAAVLAVRERVRELGVSLSETPAHRPHITLSAARLPPDEVPRLLDVVAEIAARHDPVPIRLNEVGTFARSGVLWLGPVPNRALPALQRDVYRTLKRSGWEPAFGAQTTPFRWVAHCTLATRLPRAALRTVQEALLDETTTILGNVVGLATILVGGHGDAGYASLGVTP